MCPRERSLTLSIRSRRPSSRSRAKPKHPRLNDYVQHLREVNQSSKSLWNTLNSSVDTNHLLRKYKMGAEASTFRGWRKLAKAYIADLLKAMLVAILMRLFMVLCIIAGWALVALFIWFILSY